MKSSPNYDIVDVTADMSITTQLLQLMHSFNDIDPTMYIKAKADMLNRYMRQHGLSACVVGVSGGIDSAVAYHICLEAQLQPDSPIKKVFPVFVSEELSESIIGDARKVAGDALIIIKNEDDAARIIDSLAEYDGQFEQIVEDDGWANGQRISYQRQSILYSFTSYVGARYNLVPIVIGTINKDEGAYIGYSCKAGDGLVDVQVISDITKRQVRQVARTLKIHPDIIGAEPRGDFFDGRVDKDVFGASYDLLELYQFALSRFTFGGKLEVIDLIRSGLLGTWGQGEKDALFRAFSNVEQLHRYNAHKYLVGSPAVYLDIFPVDVKGGRSAEIDGLNLPEHWVNKNPGNCMVVTIDDLMQALAYRSEERRYASINLFNSEPIYNQLRIPPVAIDLCDRLIAHFEESVPYTTNQYGFQVDINKYEGSSRVAFRCGILKELYEYITRGQIPSIIYDDVTGQYMRYVGVNPYFRIMKYEPGSILHPHLDGRYEYCDGVSNMFTVLTYLNDSPTGGTQFIRDRDDVEKADNGDWMQPPEESDIFYQFIPTKGKMIVFNGQKMLHGSERVADGDVKYVLLTELAYATLDVPDVKMLHNNEVIDFLKA